MMKKSNALLLTMLLGLSIMLFAPTINANASNKEHSGVPRFARGYWASKNLNHYKRYQKYSVSKDTFVIDGIDMAGVNYSYLKKNGNSSGYSLGTIMYGSFKKIGTNKYRIYAKKQSPLNYADFAHINKLGHHKIKIILFKKGHHDFGGSKFTLYKINKHTYEKLAKKD